MQNLETKQHFRVVMMQKKKAKKKKNKKGMTTGKRKTKCVRIHKSQEKTIFRRMAS